MRLQIKKPFFRQTIIKYESEFLIIKTVNNFHIKFFLTKMHYAEVYMYYVLRIQLSTNMFWMLQLLINIFP